MRIVDYIYDSLEKYHSFSSYPDGDCRNDFNAFIFDVLVNYYYSHVFIEVQRDFDGNRITYDSNSSPNKFHYERVKTIPGNATLLKSYKGNNNRSVIVDSLAAFEVAITTVYEHMTNQTGLARAPLKTKINRLLDLIKDRYERSMVQDKEFLDFIRELRNTMHANWIFHGEDFEYTFKNVHFIFKNEEAVVWNDNSEEVPDLYVQIADNLYDIFSEIGKACDKEFIPRWGFDNSSENE